MDSEKFLKLYNELPPEGQQRLIEQHLAAALNDMAKEKSDDILSAATTIRKEYSKAPKLDIRGKRQQITMLMDELAREAKVSLMKERGNRDELLTEIVHTLITWLNDIWSVAYEHNVNFVLAHTCLLFVGEAMLELQENAGLGGCKCSVLGLPIDTKIKDKSGKVIQKFHIVGPQHIDQILLWIWRDVLLSIFVAGTQRDKDRIPDFLNDIESVFGVSSLERLLQGGRKGSRVDDDFDLNFDDTDDDHDSDYETESDDGYSSEELDCVASSSSHCPCRFHGRHWSETVDRARLLLRDRVESRLLSIFETSPSLDVYNSLMSIGLNPDDMEDQLSQVIVKVAGYTPDNLVAGLDIFNSIGDIMGISCLLEHHSQLLRPRDWNKLQLAVSLMDAVPRNREEVFRIVERELKDCLYSILATVRSSFCHLDEDALQLELSTILKLQKMTHGRKGRIQAWVDRIITSGNPIHPMAFAAMMMGLPMVPPGDDGDDGDVLSYMDFDANDPDLDDLREEHRPNHRGRFDGWKRIAADIEGGPALLTRLYTQAIEMMPWLQDGDIVSEMIAKLGERPNKDYVLEALISLNSFAKTQRKAIRLSQRTAAKKKTTTKKTTTTVINKPDARPSSQNASTQHDGSDEASTSTLPSSAADHSHEPTPSSPNDPSHSFAHMAYLTNALFGNGEDPDSDMENMFSGIPLEVFFPPSDDLGGLDDVD